MHPYNSQPPEAFWRAAVANGFDRAKTSLPDVRYIRKGDKVASAGSCFAANLVPRIESWGFHYIRTEPVHPKFASLKENLGYRNFSAAYGNIYTARQLLQLYKRALGLFSPVEDRWYSEGLVIDPFRPGLQYCAESDAEFDVLTKQHLLCTRAAFESSTVFIFTLGLTECWESKLDGAVFPACPGTIAGKFDSDKHVFRNFTVSETVGDLLEFIDLLRRNNPYVRLVLTVSPVPLVATGTNQHVLPATIYSKSVLRVACEEVVRMRSNVSYFPAYEIVTGPQAEAAFFEADRRTVSALAVDCVMAALKANCETELDQHAQSESLSGRKVPPNSTVEMEYSKKLVDLECDEQALDRYRKD